MDVLKHGLRSAATALALVLLLLTPAAPTPAAAQSTGGTDDSSSVTPLREGVRYEWWDASWHMRVPVLIEPRFPDAVVDGRFPESNEVRNLPVNVEIDFTQAIRRASEDPERSWPQDVSGALNSFTFDPDSVRVVEYDRKQGSIVPQQDRSLVVPSQFTPTFFENRENRNDRFDPHANAVGTVTWPVEGTLGKPRLYFVYFDIKENGAKPAPDRSPSNMDALNGRYWIRSGTDVYGYAPDDPQSTSSSQARVDVYGLYEDTAVQFRRYTHSGLEPSPLERCTGSTAGVCVAADKDQDVSEAAGKPTFELQPLGRTGDTISVRPQSDQPFHFYVKADKPVLVAVRPDDGSLGNCPQGLFYPSTDGGLVGERFRFRTLHEARSAVCNNLKMKVIAPQERVQVTASWGSNGDSFTVGKGQAHTLDVPAGAAVEMRSSGPVAVVQAGYEGHFGMQVPSAYGAPVGRTFYAPIYDGLRAWSRGDDPVQVKAYDTQDASVSSSGSAGAAPHEPWLFDTTPHEYRHVRGHVFSVIAKGNASVIINPDQGIAPLGGEEGRVYEVPMRGDAEDNHRMVIYPVYDRTHVRVTDTSTGKEVFNDTVSKHRFLETKRRSEGYLFPGPGGYHVEASKPVLAYTISSNPSNGNKHTATYFSASTRTPIYHVGDGEFHGYLIRWDKTLRTLTLAPGEERRIPLEVTNLGRTTEGGNLPDDVVLQLESSRDWPVTLSSTFEPGIETFDSRRVTLLVKVPEEAETGETLQVNLTATSEGNPEMTSESEVKVAVRTRHSVDTVFRANNLKSIERLVGSGESTTYAILVNNTGTGDDAFKFTVSDCSRFGYDTRVEGPEGKVLATPDTSQGQIAIPRNQEKVVFLNVTSTGDSGLGFGCEAVVQAISVNDNSARSQVVATTVPDLNTDFRMEVENETLPIRPGENATFRVKVMNEGDDTVIRMGTSSLRLEGWSVSSDPAKFLLRANGTRDAQGNPGDVRIVNVTLTAGPDAPVGEVMDLGITAASATGEDTAAEASTRVRAVVRNNFTLDLRGMQPRSLLPGDDFTYRFSASNAANGPFDLRVNVTGLPNGWSFDKSTPLTTQRVEPSGTVNVAGDLQVPSGAESGEYNVTFSFFMETPDGDRGVHQENATIHVARRANLDVEPPRDTILVPPGDGTRVPLNVTNVGNVEMSAGLSLSTPEGWKATLLNRSQERVHLQPGESVTVDVLLEAPSRIGTRTVTWTVDADLPLGSSRSFELGASWIRRDLRIEDVRSVTRSLQPGEPGVLAVTVLNDGNLPANGVNMAIVVDGEPVKNKTIESLPPGEERVFQLPWTVVKVERNLTVVLDPANRFVETDESNNAMEVSLPREAGVPGPGLLALGLAAGLAAVAARRWRRW